MSILYPLRSVIRGGGGNLYCIVFVLWTMATLASIPNIIQTRHIQINKDNTSENIWVCTSGKYKSIRPTFFGRKVLLGWCRTVKLKSSNVPKTTVALILSLDQ